MSAEDKAELKSLFIDKISAIFQTDVVHYLSFEHNEKREIWHSIDAEIKINKRILS